MAAATTHSSLRSPSLLVVAGGGLMPPRVMLVPAGVSLPPGVHPVGLVARVAPASAGLGLEDVGFGTTRAAAGGGLHVLSSAGLGLEDVGFGTTRAAADGGRNLHVLSSNGLGLGFASAAGLGFASAAGLGSSAASRASLLGAAATPGSEAEGGDGNDSADPKRERYEEMKNTVLLAWDYKEEGTVYQSVGVFGDGYEPLSFFADGDVEAFKESADQGTLLMRALLDRGFHYNSNDMWVLCYAGLCLRRLSSQAGVGVVRDGAVLEASLAVQLVCKRLLPQVATPAAHDPKVAYTKQRVEEFVSLIESLQSVVDPE